VEHHKRPREREKPRKKLRLGIPPQKGGTLQNSVKGKHLQRNRRLKAKDLP